MHLRLFAYLLHAAFQLLCHPRVEAPARKGGSEIDPPLRVGADARDELAGEKLFRFLPALLAQSKVILDGIAECLAQFGDAGDLERYEIPNVDDFAVKDLDLVVVLEGGYRPSWELPLQIWRLYELYEQAPHESSRYDHEVHGRGGKLPICLMGIGLRE
jgi:hypothetical protein